MSIQKRVPCKRGCGTLIHWDDQHVSKTGIKIPLEDDGEPHQCPNALPYNKEGPTPRQQSPADLGLGIQASELTHAIERLTTRIEELIQRMDNR